MKGASKSGKEPPEEEIGKQSGTHVEEVSSLGNGSQATHLASPHEPLPETESEISQDPVPRKKIKIIPKQSDVDKAFTEWLEIKNNKAQTPLEQKQEDSDWLFFRSILQDFKKLDEKRRRNLKIKFATLLNEELDQVEIEASNTHSISSS